MAIRRCLLLALMCAALSLNATSFRTWNPEDLLENPQYDSENGRYTLVVRQYPVVGDFASVRLDTIVDFNSEEGFRLPHDGDKETEVAAFYDGRRLLSVMKITEDHSRLLISDSGDRIIAAGTLDVTWRRSETIVTIYDTRGGRIRAITMPDAFTPADVKAINFGAQIELSLQVDEEHGEIVELAAGKTARVRIRTSDGTLVDPRRDLLPVPRVYATATREPAPIGRFVPSPEDACFETVARIASSQLVARAVEWPLPSFPEVARRARIRGRVWVEVVVSESGDVTCARATGLPFGIREAALAGARQWKFTPYEIDGRRVPVTSEILFHFVDVDPREWEELQGSPR